MSPTKTDSSPADLMTTLEARFAKHPERHPSVTWDEVRSRLESAPEKLTILGAMEQTGGEPDVTGRDAVTGQVVFTDCSAETPALRRSLCYDQPAWEGRKENKPAGSALALAAQMGSQILDETQYRELQSLGEFDLKTSSWILTPQAVRTKGGALFCDRRYGQVFTYHNGAESYYGVRGFRSRVEV